MEICLHAGANRWDNPEEEELCFGLLLDIHTLRTQFEESRIKDSDHATPYVPNPIMNRNNMESCTFSSQPQEGQ